MKVRAKAASGLALVLGFAAIASYGQNPAEQAAGAEQAADPAITAKTKYAAKGDYGIPENPTWGRAIVASNQVSDLIAFEQEFKDVLGSTDLEEHWIGCVLGCAELSSTPPPKTLEYVFALEHQDIFNIFGKAWDNTEKTAVPKVDPDFRITFKAHRSPAVCPYPPHPQPCKDMPICSDSCGRKDALGIPRCGLC